MSLRYISNHIKETYDTYISSATLSTITDKVIPLVKEWQQRPLEILYCIVWLDAMYYKVKEEGRTHTFVYNILASECIKQKWTMPLVNWAISASQLKIIFADSFYNHS